MLDRLWDQDRGSGQFSYAPRGKPHKGFRDPLSAAELGALLDQVERQLRAIGQAIFNGAAQVSPYARGNSETACQSCLYGSICRFDPWLHEYRRLHPPM